MAAEQWKAPNTKIESPNPSPLGVSAPNALVNRAKRSSTVRLVWMCGLNRRV